jgi:small subunit ribosomal protein S20
LANHKSALKRARQNNVRRLRNKSVRTRLKSAVKNVRAAVSDNLQDNVAKELNLAKSVIDNAAKKGTIHKRTAARKISRLSKLVNSISA